MGNRQRFMAVWNARRKRNNWGFLVSAAERGNRLCRKLLASRCLEARFPVNNPYCRGNTTSQWIVQTILQRATEPHEASVQAHLVLGPKGCFGMIRRLITTVWWYRSSLNWWSGPDTIQIFLFLARETVSRICSVNERSSPSRG